MIGCLRTRVRKQPINALYFEFENELKFYVRKQPIIVLYFEFETVLKFYNLKDLSDSMTRTFCMNV